MRAITHAHKRKTQMGKNTETETAETDGATAGSRAVNKLRQLGKATASIGDTALSVKLVESAAAIEKILGGPKGAQLEAALRRNRSSDFEAGMRVKLRDQFKELYGKNVGTLDVVEVTTVGGDDNKRGGRSFVKAKTASGNVIVAPASTFEAA